MSRSTLYLIPPQRLLCAAQHAERSSREAVRRGHMGAARLWQEIQKRCLTALEDTPHDGDVVRRESPTLREVELRQVQDRLGPGALTGVGRSARKKVHTVADEQGVCRMIMALRRASLRLFTPSVSRCVLTTTARRVRQGVLLIAAEVA